MYLNSDMYQDTKEIEKITFGVYSADEIKKLAVCKIDSPKLCDKDNSFGTVYDPRLGTIENGKMCVTCGLNVWGCNG